MQILMNVLLTMEAVSVILHSMRTDVLLDVLILLVLIIVPVMKDTHWQQMLAHVLVSIECCYAYIDTEKKRNYVPS